MKQKGFAKIDNILLKTSQNQQFKKAYYKHQTLKHWHEVVSGFITEARELTQAISFEKGILTVACLSREVASQIKILATKIVEALNQVLGRRLVYAIYTEC